VLSVRKSFQSVIGKQPENATMQDIDLWQRSLLTSGLKLNTCRTYLYTIKKLAEPVLNGTQLPKCDVVSKRILSEEEIKHMLSVVTVKDYSWLASMLLTGPEIITWKWGWLYDAKHILPIEVYSIIVAEATRRGYSTFPFQYWAFEAHWVTNYNPADLIWDISQHEINRRLKGVAVKAGIGSLNMNVTTIKYAHQQLISRYANADKVSKALGIGPAKPEYKPAIARLDTRLHGIGRRSPLIKSA